MMQNHSASWCARGLLHALLIMLSAGLAATHTATAAIGTAATPTSTMLILPTPPPMPTAPLATLGGASASRPTAIATPPLTARPDGCEPNDDRAHACALGADAVGGPFTFLPIGDQDYYRLELAAPSGLATTITVRAAGDLDLLTSVSRDDGTPLAAISSPAISTTLAPDIAGRMILRIENRSPTDPSGSSYSVEVRRTLPPPRWPQGGAAAPTLAPDWLENNWNADTAAPIAIGVVYDLNFSCPETWAGACGGGDHDYLAVPVKAGGDYLIATFDLGPGVDTVLDLFWGDRDTPLASNDDIYRAGMLSALHWHAPADGTAIVRIGPRNGGATPIVDDTRAGFYRFAVVLAESDLARQLEERIRAQSGAPAPVPPPGSGAAAPGGSAAPAPAPVAPAAPNVPGVFADARQGPAVVAVESSVLREGPDARARAIQPLPRHAMVTLLGQVSGSWVRVQPMDGVVPGWVYGPDLRPLNGSPTPASIHAELTPAAGQAPPADAAALATPATPHFVVTQLDRAPLAPPTALPARRTLAVSVTLLIAMVPLAATAGPGMSQPAPAPALPLGGVRVQLVTVFGDVLAEAVTPASGTVRLTRDLDAGLAVFVRVSAAGLQVPIDPNESSLTLAIPTGDQP